MKFSRLANAVRFLSIDAVQQANSGHPGAPMGMADIATVLWREFLQHNPNNPSWFNRDRFVLSNGHASMLLYSLLHLTGYELSLNDLKHFRQLNSKTPGHPEHGHTPGVETTTGPLGQGIANAVGMALAERILAASFNRPNFNIVDHHTYAFVGDGCLMEGISHEVCSLAGTLKLSKLIAFWDDNGISIDGEVKSWFSDDTPERFEAYGWHVIRDVDGHDPAAIRSAISAAKANIAQPTLICCRTKIAFGSPNLVGTCQTHGAPLGNAEIAMTREAMDWPYGPFEIPQEIYQDWNAKATGQEQEEAWRDLFKNYEQTYPELAAEFVRRQVGLLPENWAYQTNAFIHQCQKDMANIASRKASQNAITAYAKLLPEFLGGSADLTHSNLTVWAEAKSITPEDMAGNYIHYGVRESGMVAMMNGMALHGGFIPFGGTFLVFADYARNAIRLAALMRQRVIFVLTHDSIGLGEDGPTHQPIEHLAMLRMTPGLSVWRPCDATETAVAWQLAVERHVAPTCLALSRQNLASQQRTDEQVAAISRGAYVLWENAIEPELILISTGSEIGITMQAARIIADKGKAVRVVSMPSTDVFDAQSADYHEQVLPSHIEKRIAIEAAASDYWFKYVGLKGHIIGLQRYGVSAPADKAYIELGITVEAIIAAASR